MPRPAPPPGNRRGCGSCPHRRKRHRGSCGTAPSTPSTPSGTFDGRRPAPLSVHDAVDDGTAYRAELAARVDQPVLSDDPVLQRDLQLPDSWWQDLAGTLEKVAAVDTDRVAVRQQYMDRAIPEFVGIPAPAVTCWSAAHSDLYWANATTPLRLLDWEG
ncbi:hypothetical protein ABTZ58_37350 [Streptomyces sp. NPDC094143]|uniref:hypothetical protein n=1 Tax=Streptomyces sp. NPDC094143 TaxID=3155310 RepID=UPI00331C60F6